MSTVTPYLNLVKPAPLENFSRATYNTNLDLVDTDAITQNKAAKGFMPGGKSRTTASAAVSALSVLENIATFTFKGGRKYRIGWDCSYAFSVASDAFTVSIQSCSTADAATLTTGLTELVSRVKTVPAANQGTHLSLNAVYEPASDITLQIKFLVSRIFGSGTFTMEASKSWFTIEDLGAQY